jgi:hypothetical protein
MSKPFQAIPLGFFITTWAKWDSRWQLDPFPESDTDPANCEFRWKTENYVVFIEDLR